MSKKKVDVVRDVGGVVNRILNNAIHDGGGGHREGVKLRIRSSREGKRVRVDHVCAGLGTWSLNDEILDDVSFKSVQNYLRLLTDVAPVSNIDDALAIGHCEWVARYNQAAYKMTAVFVAEDGVVSPIIYVVLSTK